MPSADTKRYDCARLRPPVAPPAVKRNHVEAIRPFGSQATPRPEKIVTGKPGL